MLKTPLTRALDEYGRVSVATYIAVHIAELLVKKDGPAYWPTYHEQFIREELDLVANTLPLIQKGSETYDFVKSVVEALAAWDDYEGASVEYTQFDIRYVCGPLRLIDGFCEHLQALEKMGAVKKDSHYSLRARILYQFVCYTNDYVAGSQFDFDKQQKVFQFMREMYKFYPLLIGTLPK